MPRLLVAALVCLVLPLSASREPQSLPLRLPVRVHLLRSPESVLLSATYTERDVKALLATANAVWRQAGITWELESIVHDDAPHGAQFDSVVTGLLKIGATWQSILPTHDRLVPGWNVYIVHDLGPLAGGTFDPSFDGVLLGERGHGSALAPTAGGGTTLAHELAHSLGIDHEDCDDSHNIMANDCGGVEPGSRSLTPDQIVRAKIQAARGDIVTRLPADAPLPTNLGFEVPLAGWPAFPAGWYVVREFGPEISRDSVSPLEGRFSLKTQWTKSRAYSGAALAQLFQQYPIELVRGRVLHFAAYIRTEAITTGSAHLFLRVGGEGGRGLAFANLRDRAPTGTTPWTRYDVEIPVDSLARNVVFGVMHAGNGTAWFDSLTVEVVRSANRQ